MAQPNPVKVLDVFDVAPPPRSPDSTAPETLPLTFFDLFWLRFAPTHRLFFYEFPCTKATLTDSILPKLKHSLSAALKYYLPVAGNLTWPPDSGKPILRYKEGDSISLTVAESEVNFYRLSGTQFREPEEFHPFLPVLTVSETRAPVLAFQVTLFPDAGFSIGYAARHAVFDGKSIAMFMHSWASICRLGEASTLTAGLTPYYDRSIINDPYDFEKPVLSFHLSHNGPNNRTLEIKDMETPLDVMLGTFQLTKANIESIKNWVEAKWQEKEKGKPAIRRPSTFAITSAYTWVHLIRARKLYTDKVQLFINVNCRARLEPPIPTTYFGNCVSMCIVDSDTNKLMGEDGVAVAARAIGEAIRGLDDGVLNGAKELMSQKRSIEKEGVIGIAGSPWLELYDTDFGWGRPKKVEMVSIMKTGAFSLSDARDGNGGIEIGVVLHKDETEAFASMFASGLIHHQAQARLDSQKDLGIF